MTEESATITEEQKITNQRGDFDKKNGCSSLVMSHNGDGQSYPYKPMLRVKRTKINNKTGPFNTRWFYVCEPDGPLEIQHSFKAFPLPLFHKKTTSS